MKEYGITNRNTVSNKIEYHKENLKIKGFSIEENLLSNDFCDKISDKLIYIYQKQEKDFGRENLQNINELDLCRMPFLHDKSFFDLFMNPMVLEITEKILGKFFTLHLQNGIINKPNEEHHQSSWHRDLPYQDWIISKPLALNAFYCITEFTKDNGATFLLPYSHRLDYFPSSKFVEENSIQLEAPKGSVVFFDSMLYHRAGYNKSHYARIGINNMFVVPIIKQQIDIPAHFSTDQLSVKEAEVLGLSFKVPESIEAYRSKKLFKKN